MAGALPKADRKKYKARVRHYEQEAAAAKAEADDETDGSGTDPTDGAQSKDSLLARAGQKSKEIFLTRRNLVKALGIVAMAGIGYAVAKGYVSAEHANLLQGVHNGAEPVHAQLMADVQTVKNVPHPAVAHTPNPTISVGPPKPNIVGQSTSLHMSGEDLPSKIESIAWDSSLVGLAARGIYKIAKSRHEKKADKDHLKHEKEHRNAEHLSLVTMVEDDPDSAALIDAMKFPMVRDEIVNKGVGGTGATYSRDIVGRYARLIAPKVGGTAEGVKEHLEHLGITLGAGEIFDAPTPAGGTAIDIRNASDEDLAAIAEQLVDGHLHYGDLPPTSALFGDSDVMDTITELVGDPANGTTGLYDTMRRAAEHPYTKWGTDETVHEVRYFINRKVQNMFTKIASNLPTDAARHAALHALRLNDLITEGTPANGGPSTYWLKTVGTGGIPAGRAVSQRLRAA